MARRRQPARAGVVRGDDAARAAGDPLRPSRCRGDHVPARLDDAGRGHLPRQRSVRLLQRGAGRRGRGRGRRAPTRRDSARAYPRDRRGDGRDDSRRARAAPPVRIGHPRILLHRSVQGLSPRSRGGARARAPLSPLHPFRRGGSAGGSGTLRRRIRPRAGHERPSCHARRSQGRPQCPRSARARRTPFAQRDVVEFALSPPHVRTDRGLVAARR